jgi:hypothetical protein
MTVLQLFDPTATDLGDPSLAPQPIPSILR